MRRRYVASVLICLSVPVPASAYETKAAPNRRAVVVVRVQGQASALYRDGRQV